MTQTARPTLDLCSSSWTTFGGVTVALYDGLREEIRNDAAGIQSVLDPASSVYVVRLASVVDPEVHTGHALRYACRKDAADCDRVDLIVQLRQTYVSEASPGTLIACETQHDLCGTAWTTGTLALSEGEAGTITDYGALAVRLVANTP